MVIFLAASIISLVLKWFFGQILKTA
jgi:hypothetical protein